MSNFTRNLSFVLGTSAFLTAGTLNLSAPAASAQLVAVGAQPITAKPIAAKATAIQISGASTTAITVDETKNRIAINPNIYGVSNLYNNGNPDSPSTSDTSGMNTPLVRKGGNLDSTYNWLLDSFDHGFDYFFESSPDSGGNGSVADSFVNRIQSGGGKPMLTIPMLKYVATNGYSFSVSKYRPDGYVPVATAPENSDIGNGVTGTNPDSGRNLYFTGNDPTDANTANSTGFQQSWVQHLIAQHNTATNGGVPYYILDNEPDDWFDEHADVDPGGVKLADLQSRLINYSAMVKGVDGSALTVGPEISGWYSYFYSGYDLCQGAQYDNYNFTDYNSYGTDPNTGSTYNFLPKLLADLKSNDSGKAHQTLDVFTVHYYPQQNEYSDDVSSATQQERNVSTRSLWDPTYQDASFIGSSGLNDGAGDGHVNLLPTLRAWATTYYGSGLQTGLTEYSWGADGDMSGATAQADILGIFGRGITTNGKTNPGIDLATRFTSPASGTPVYKVFQMYRNYDGAKSTFGNISVSCTSSSNPNVLSAFASHTVNATFTGHDVTVMVVNKQASATQAINISSTLLPYCYIPTGETATVYQLAAVNGVSSNAAITKLTSIPVSSQALTATVAAQSVTLFKYHVNYVWNHVFHLTLASAALQKLLAAQMANRLSTQKVSVKFVNTATGALTDETDGIYSDDQGNVYVGTSSDGTFDIVVKPAGGLSQTFHAVATGTGSTTAELGTMSLLLGDVNGDNAVDITDYSAVLGAYGTNYTQAGFNTTYDIDGDGVIGANDLAIIKANIRAKGN